MRISDWSSDVCSSDLANDDRRVSRQRGGQRRRSGDGRARRVARALSRIETHLAEIPRRLVVGRSEEHTSELQSLMRISYAVFCLKKKNNITQSTHKIT